MAGGRNKRELIVRTLAEDIGGGRFVPLGPFPSEHMLMARFGVARETIRMAVKELEDRGLVYRRRGAGTFVSSRVPKVKARIGTLFTGARYSEIFSRMARAIARAAERSGVDVVCADGFRLDCAAVGRKAVGLAKKLVAAGVQGVVLQPVAFAEDSESANAEVLGVFADRRVPVVLVDCDAVCAPRWSGHDLVALDNFSAGCSLAVHLSERRVARVAFVARRGFADSVRLRLAGVQCAIGAANVDQVLVDDCACLTGLAAALRSLPGLDAVVCQNDVAAVSVSRALAQMGLSVPRDVLLAGFDDVSLARSMNPPLTTVRQPCEEIAGASFRRLLDRMRDPSLPPETILLHGVLTARGSTDLFRPPKVV